jgi:glycosyltransferase involved in cell wall biosynthesis
MPSTTPFITCIVTAFNEGALAAVSIRSLLAQSFADFEIIVVDDGASEETRRTLQSFDDPRVRLIRQANDGLSSARNRGLQHARGEYVCFLDSDDTRPGYAFEEMARIARESNADCIFSPGMLCEPRNDLHPFYDQEIFNKLQARQLARVDEPGPRLVEALRLLLAIEPQSANKLVRRSFLEKHRIRFPSGLFFEDIVFHNVVLMNVGSVAITELPTFTYYRRYGRPQITGTQSTLRFDAISSAGNVFDLFRQSRYFHDIEMRMTLLAATFKLLRWCEESTSHALRWSYRQALQVLIMHMDERYLAVPDASTNETMSVLAPWTRESLSYFDSVASDASAMGGA